MLFASATPIIPGRTDRYRALADELGHYMGEYKALNERYRVARHSYWISHARDGSDIGVSVYDMSPDGLALMKTRQWDSGSAHDAWWLEFVHDVNGVDMLEQPAHREPPELVFSWARQ